MSETTETPTTGVGLAGALQGSEKQRLEEEKSITIKMVPGEKPQVEFVGFWNGRILNAAMNSISRAYRLRRHHVIREAKVETKGGEGDEGK